MIARTRRLAEDHLAIWLLAGSVAFGVLMGSRTEFSELWQRDVVAGVAVAVMGLTIAQMRRARAGR